MRSRGRIASSRVAFVAVLAILASLFVVALPSSASPFAIVASGQIHTCAVTSAGAVKCWGAASSGQLGNGSDFPSRSVPVDVTGLSAGVSGLIAGWNHTCAITGSGGAKCWGDSSNGKLGAGPTGGVNGLVPLDVVGLSSGVEDMGAGSNHTCALTATGAVKCWGFNIIGQLGNGSNLRREHSRGCHGLVERG